MSLSRSFPRPASRLALGLLLVVAACVGRHTSDEAQVNFASEREGVTGLVNSLVAEGRFKQETWRADLSELAGKRVNAKRITVDGDLLLIEDTDHWIHALDRKSGEHRWLVQLDAATTQTPGGTASTVTFVSTDDVVAIGRARGDRRNGTPSLPRPTNHMEFFPSGRAVTVDSTTYVGRLAPFGVQALDLAGGSNGWSYATRSPVLDVVAHGDGRLAQVVAATEDGLVVSLPPRGANDSTWAPQEKWYHRVAGGRIVTPLTLSGDSLVFGGDNGFLYHLDARSGVVRWKVPCGEMRGHEALVAGGSVYQPRNGDVKAYDAANGHELWTDCEATRAITRIGDHVYMDHGAKVRVLDAKSGKTIAEFDTHGLVLPSVPDGGALYASDGSNVFALD
jgi:outer membrane protein assembly factor BamB